MEMKSIRFAAVMAVLLALALVFMAPVGAETCTEESCTHVAAVGEEHYSTLQEALDAASDENVVLLQDITIVGIPSISGNIYNAIYESDNLESDDPADDGLFYAPYQNEITSHGVLIGTVDNPAVLTMSGSYTGSNAVLLSGKMTVTGGSGIYGSEESMKAWMNVNVNGGYTFGVGYSTSEDISGLTFDETNPIVLLELQSGAEIARIGHIFVGSDDHDKGENAYVLNIDSGATIKDFGQLTTRGDGTINVDGSIICFTTKSYQSSSAADTSMHENAKDGGHSNNNGIINVGESGSIKIDSMNVGRKPSLNTGNAELNVNGGTVEFTNYINVGYDSSERIGEINLNDGAKLISQASTYTLKYNNGKTAGTETKTKAAGTLTIGVAANGVVNMDASSKISVGTINVGESGSIIIDASDFTASEATKVIEQTVGTTSLEEKVTVNNLPAGYLVSYEDGDVTIVPSVASITTDGTTVGYATLQAAVDAAENGQTITIISDIDLKDSTVNIPAGKEVTLDLNGKTIAVTESATGSYGFINVVKGTFTLDDSVGNGKITLDAENDRDWNAYSSVISVQQGSAIINGGTIQHLGGTDMAYGIDVLLNSGIGDASLTVNDGSIISPYRAIRLFPNSIVDDTTTLSLEINGGSISGDNAGIWIQLPGSCYLAKPNVEFTVTDGTISSTNRAIYSSTQGNSFYNTEISIEKGTFNGDVELSYGLDNRCADESAETPCSYCKGKCLDDVQVKDLETVTVSGGTFTGKVFSNGVYEPENKKQAMGPFVTGGTFSEDPSEYVKDTHEAVLVGGKYVVAEKDSLKSGISATDVGFDSVKVGYTQPEAKKVTVTNTGDVDVVLLQPTVENYIVTGFTDGILTILAGESAEFTIQPEAGLAVGNYGVEEVTLEAEDGATAIFEVSFLVYQPSSGGSSKPTDEPVDPEQPDEQETPVDDEPEAGESTVETEVTDGGEVELETPVEAPVEGEGGAPAADKEEAKITTVVLPTGTEGKVEFIPVSEQPAPAGKETQTKKVFEINVPTYEKGKAAVIKFTMTVAELAADGKEAADVALWHFDEETGEWTKLVTSYTIVDGIVYFEAITNDFSPFAIVYEDEPVDEPVDEPETPASPAPVLGLITALGAAVLLRRK